MEPYTREGITRKEAEQLKTNSGGNHGSNNGNGVHHEPMKVETDNQRYYELVGVVVHSGQASAGHYYSFVKNRQWVYIILRRPDQPDFHPTKINERANIIASGNYIEAKISSIMRGDVFCLRVQGLDSKVLNALSTLYYKNYTLVAYCVQSTPGWTVNVE